MDYKDDLRFVFSSLPSLEVLRGKNILVTGSTGLIGSTLIDLLMINPNLDYHVYASGRNEKRALSLFSCYTNNPNFHFIKYDVLDPFESDISFQYIISCAGLASPQLYSMDPVGVMKSNFMGVEHLFSYGIEHDLEEFIYLSSGEVYGEGDGRPFQEEYSGYVNCATLRACYPSAKRATESLCVAYGYQYNVNVKIIRPCHVFGPHFSSSDRRVYAQFLRNVLAGNDIVLKSLGQQVRSWCYVVDCASAILYIIAKGQNGEAYNVADRNSVLSIHELAELFSRIGGCSIKYELPEEVEELGYSVVTKSVFDTCKIEDLGWAPSFRISDAILHTLNYLRN